MVRGFILGILWKKSDLHRLCRELEDCGKVGLMYIPGINVGVVEVWASLKDSYIDAR